MSEESKMTTLKLITSQDFKSYRGAMQFGPLGKLLAIIGSNGCGKSNMMDAASFVMGASLPCLRVRRYGDLIHGANIGKPIAECASVTAVFEVQEEELQFTRTAYLDTCSYFIDTKNVDMREYLAALSQLGLTIDAKNFLIFQGQIEEFALQKPKTLALFFESLSSSSNLRPEYNHLQKVMRKQGEELNQLVYQQQDLQKQIFLAKQQKNEETNCKELEETVLRLKQELCLFYAMHNKHKIDHMQSRAERLKHTVDRLEANREDFRQHLENQMSQFRKCEENMVALSCSMKRKGEENAETNMALEASKDLVCGLEQQLRCASNNLKCAYEAKGNHTSEMDILQQELVNVDRLCHELDKQIDIEDKTFHMILGMPEEQKLELAQQYKQLKLQSATQARGMLQEKETLQRKLETWDDKLSNSKRNLVDAQTRLNLLDKEKTDKQEKIDEVKKSNFPTNTTVKPLEDEARKLEKSLRIANDELGHLNKEYAEVMHQITLNKIDKNVAAKLRQQEETLVKLKTNFTGVHDRLVNMCSPKGEKYKKCVTRALSANMDAIVVDTTMTAMNCIEFLREHRIDRERFLPLDNIKGPSIKTDPKNVHCVPLIQVIRIEMDNVCNLISYLTKNAVVCNNMDDALQVACGDEDTNRIAISLDGTLINTDGIIAGGEQNMMQKAKQWDAKKRFELNTEAENLKESIDKRGSTILLDNRRLAILKSEISALKAKHRPARDRLLSLEADKASIEEKIRQLSPIVDQNKMEVHRILAERKLVAVKWYAIKTRCDSIDDNVFMTFCQQINVANIRQYENILMKTNKKYLQNKQDLIDQQERIQHQLDYDKSKIEKIQGNVERWTNTEKERTVSLEAAKAKLAQLCDIEQNLTREIKQLQLEFDQRDSARVDLKVEADKLRQTLRKAKDQASEAKEKYDKIAIEIEQEKIANFDMLQQYTFRGIHIPLQGAAPMAIDDSDEGEMSEIMLNLHNIMENRDNIQIDFSSLVPELTRHMSADEFLENEARLNANIASCEDKICEISKSRLQFLKDTDKLKEEKAKLDLDIEHLRGELTSVTKHFHKIKEKRQKMFFDCFDVVQENIDQIYKNICSSSSGQAYLMTENAEEPYLGGILYNCVVPGKRFHLMSDMSGGEQVLAAVALVFATLCYMKPPFIIMDEVDASLDKLNLVRLTKFLKVQSSSIQIILISHNKTVFQMPREICAMWSTAIDNNSRMVTFDMGRYHDLAANIPHQAPNMPAQQDAATHAADLITSDFEVEDALQSDSDSGPDPYLRAMLDDACSKAKQEEDKIKSKTKSKVSKFAVHQVSMSDSPLLDSEEPIQIMRGPIKRFSLVRPIELTDDESLRAESDLHTERAATKIKEPTRNTSSTNILQKVQKLTISKTNVHKSSVSRDMALREIEKVREAKVGERNVSSGVSNRRETQEKESESSSMEAVSSSSDESDSDEWLPATVTVRKKKGATQASSSKQHHGKSSKNKKKTKRFSKTLNKKDDNEAATGAIKKKTPKQQPKKYHWDIFGSDDSDTNNAQQDAEAEKQGEFQAESSVEKMKERQDALDSNISNLNDVMKNISLGDNCGTLRKSETKQESSSHTSDTNESVKVKARPQMKDFITIATHDKKADLVVILSDDADDKEKHVELDMSNVTVRKKKGTSKMEPTSSSAKESDEGVARNVTVRRKRVWNYEAPACSSEAGKSDTSERERPILQAKRRVTFQDHVHYISDHEEDTSFDSGPPKQSGKKLKSCLKKPKIVEVIPEEADPPAEETPPASEDSDFDDRIFT